MVATVAKKKAKVAPGRKSERERDAERKREARAKEKVVEIPKCANRARRNRLEADDEAWLRYYFAPESGSEDPFTYDFTLQQKEMIQAIRNAILHGGDQTITASRGEGKTTYGERVMLKYILQGVIKFAVLFAATGGKAEDSLEAIKTELENNTRLIADYPEVCVPIIALEGAPQRAGGQLVRGKRLDNRKVYDRARSKFSWCGQEIYFPKVPGSPSSGAIIATRGLDAAVRGLKKMGRRVDLAIIDDPDTEDTARSEEQAKKLEERIDRAIAGLGSQKRSVARVMLTTLQNRICVSYKFSDPKQKPSWNPKKFRFLITAPTRKDLWDEYVQLKVGDWNNKTSLAHELYVTHRDAMDAGAEVANPNRYFPGELSALQSYYNLVAKLGPEAVATEYDNDPPEDETSSRLVLTSYHIQNNCLSGIDKRVVPEGTVGITVGSDVQKLGLHYVAIAWNEHAAGCIIDYDFFEFLTAGKKASDCEVNILEGLFAWHDAQLEMPFLSANGDEHFADLTLVDMGWKDESWNSQPVQVFCGQVGFSAFMPSKGFSPYRRPHDSNRTIIGENWHVAFPGGVPIVEMNSDHWKLKVHEGFLVERGMPGSLTLFDAPRVDGRQNRTFHMSYAKHVLSETWESRFVPGFKGTRTGWWKSPKPNHYFDATYAAIVARSMRGISVLESPTLPTAPVVAVDSQPSAPPQGFGERQRW